jgi:hypothetical protein
LEQAVLMTERVISWALVFFNGMLFLAGPRAFEWW